MRITKFSFQILLGVLFSCSAMATDLALFRSMYGSKQYEEAYRILEKKLSGDISKESRSLTLFGLGITAYEMGNFEKAKENLNLVLENGSKLADFAHFYLGLANLKLDNIKDAKKHFQAVESFNEKSQKVEEAKFQLGEIAIKEKKWSDARIYFRYLERKWRNTGEYPAVVLNLIQSESKADRKWVSCRWARKLYRQYPASPMLSSWGIDLQNAQIGGEKSGCVASLDDQRKRIRNLQHNGQSARARQEIEELARRSPSSQKYRTDTLLADFLVNEGLVQEALEILLPYYDSKKSETSYLMLLAKAASRAEEYKTAVGAFYQAYKNSPRSSSGKRALFEGSFLSYQFKDYDGALRKFEEFQNVYRGSGLARDANWYRSWIQYLRKDYQSAKTSFASSNRVTRRGRNLGLSEKTQYWLAMANLKSGDLATAKKKFQVIASPKSYSYYAIASRARLETLKDVDIERELAKQTEAPQPPTEGEVPTDVAQANGAGTDESKEDETTVLNTEAPAEGEEAEEDVAASDPIAEGDAAAEAPQLVTTFKDPRLVERFERASDLEALGFNELARWELWAIEKRTANREYLRSLMTHYERIGAYHRASYIGQTHFGAERLNKGIAGSRKMWEFAFPKAYARSVETFASRFNIPKELVWGIMRAESNYKVDARSPVGALGLMQIMPYTGARLAKLLKIEGFDPPHLLEPDMNIRLGSRYLGRLSEKFDSNLPLIAAAYNAGPHRVDRWLKAFGHLEMDEFIEHIPFLQTREYVKKVTQNFYLYKQVYEKSDEAIKPLAWLSQPIGIQVADISTAREDWSDLESQ